MKIYINGRFLTQMVTGVQRYATELIRALDQILVQEKDCKDEYILLMPSHRISTLSLQKIQQREVGRLSGHLWEQIELPFYCRDGLLLNFCNCAPLVKKQQLVTIHDAGIMAVPRAYSWKFRLWYRLMYTVLGKRVSAITTVSKFSKQELQRCFSVPQEKMKVVYNGIDHINGMEKDESIQKTIGSKKYVLAVSSKSISKNFKLVLKCAAKLSQVQFVIAGGMNSRVFSDSTVKNYTNVRYIGYVSDSELVSLYNHATIFVYPSLYEGFGIPPLEAMACNCPVIVSNKASLPEICGDAALYCDVHDEASLLEKITMIMNDDELAKKLKNKGLQKIKKYTWRNEANKLRKIIDDITKR